jgi:D-glycero-beta-D-manno-heptose 1-phosphate adenylyltransferase
MTNLDSGEPSPSLGTWSQVLSYDPRIPDVKIFGRSWSEKKDNEVPHSLWLRSSDLPKLIFPRPMILVNGCFDILHTGHLSLIWKARQIVGLSGSVFVVMDSDDMVRAKKGPTRPILTFQERASALRYLSINYITEVNDDKHFLEIFHALKPDVRIKDESKKYQKSRIDKDLCTTVYIPKLGGVSTSEIITRIKEKI